MLFLVVGNLVLATGSSVAADMRGMLKVRPWSAALLFVGLFAVTGSPPFGLFVSEFSIVSGAIRQDHWLVAAAMLVLLAIIFVGIGGMLLKIIFGTGTETTTDDEKATGDSALLLIGPLGLAALVVMLGLYIPSPLQDSLARAARLLGGVAP
jgi:hydrogenase-4 component F